MALKRTDFLDDQVLMGASAPGGLSETTRADYRTAAFGATVAAEVGYFGLRPDILSEVLAGARVQVRSSAPPLGAPGRTPPDGPPDGPRTDPWADPCRQVVPEVKAYKRTIGGDQSPTDLETALQLVRAAPLRPSFGDGGISPGARRRAPLSVCAGALPVWVGPGARRGRRGADSLHGRGPDPLQVRPKSVRSRCQALFPLRCPRPPAAAATRARCSAAP